MLRPRLLVSALFLLLVAASAWVHDDAYITFRTVDNLVAGHGPVWNVAERVQTFTHPLWMLLHVPFRALGAPFYETTFLLSVGASLGAFLLLLHRVAPPREDAGRSAALAGALLLTSRSFVEYSTSGLENPLTHLLLAVLVVAWLRLPRESPGPRSLFPVALTAGLLALNRLDTALLALPILLDAWWRRPRDARAIARRSLGVALGLLPVVVWLAFAAVYYGDPIPNTALAKLGIGVDTSARLLRGGAYLLGGFLEEPAFLAIFAGAALAARSGRAPKSPVLGALLYLAYVAWTGGGYMQGRFLTAPAFLAVLALARVDLAALARRALARHRFATSALVLLIVLRGATSSWLGSWPSWSPSDERRRFYHSTGWLAGLGEPRWPNHFFGAKGEVFRDCGPDLVVDAYVGFLGQAAGPRVHIVDLLGLTDPLLARLPGILTPETRSSAFGWGPGHVSRPLPRGYLESLETGENRIADPSLRDVYEDVRLLSRAPLDDPGRLGAALRLQRRPEPRIGDYLRRHPELFSSPAADLRTRFVPALSGGEILLARETGECPEG